MASSLPSIDELDARIHYHLEEAAALRRLRNAHSSINRLPTEILAHVFSFCRAPTQWPVYCNPFTQFNKLATQVCHLWRDTALSTPRLWALLPCGQELDRLEQVMKRSKNAPLTINMSRHQHGDVEEMMQIICRDMSRIQDLKLECTHALISTIMRTKALASPCSSLISLDLEVTPAHHYRNKESTSSVPPLSSSCVEAPCLTTLRLVGCTEYLNHIPLSGLRYLHLERGAGLKEPVRLIQLLTNVRELRCLEVVGMNAMETDSVMQPDAPLVQFSFLTRLRLEGHFKTILCYVQRLVAPALSHIQLQFDSVNGGNLTTIRKIPLITTFIDKWMQEPNSVALLEEDYGFKIACKQVDQAELQTHIPEASTANSRLILLFAGLPPHTKQATQLASDALQLCSSMCVVRLSIATMNSLTVTKGMWLQMFPLAKVTSVQRVDVTESSTQGLLDALGVMQKIPGRKRGKRGDQYFLPSLNYIRFVNVDFANMLTGKKTLGQQLKLRLKARASQRLKLSTLEIDGCQGYADEELDEIEGKHWVGNLYWDGEDGDGDDDESGCGGHGIYCDCGDIHDFEDSDYFGSDVDGAYFF